MKRLTLGAGLCLGLLGCAVQTDNQRTLEQQVIEASIGSSGLSEQETKAIVLAKKSIVHLAYEKSEDDNVFGGICIGRNGSKTGILTTGKPLVSEEGLYISSFFDENLKEVAAKMPVRVAYRNFSDKADIGLLVTQDPEALKIPVFPRIAVRSNFIEMVSFLLVPTGKNPADYYGAAFFITGDGEEWYLAALKGTDVSTSWDSQNGHAFNFYSSALALNKLLSDPEIAKAME